MQGIAAAMEAAGLSPAQVGIVIHGTTLATNALIERKGATTALIVTEGFRDSVEMASENRFEQYDIYMERQKSEEHTSELQSLMRISYAVLCLKKKKSHKYTTPIQHHKH